MINVRIKIYIKVVLYMVVDERRTLEDFYVVTVSISSTFVISGDGLSNIEGLCLILVV